MLQKFNKLFSGTLLRFRNGHNGLILGSGIYCSEAMGGS